MAERRFRGERRWEFEPEFPLIDSRGVTVIRNRRRIADRRLDNITLEERLTLFSEMPLLDPARDKRYSS
jgi:hypothetical protein